VFGARVLGCDPIEPSPRFIAEAGIEMTGLESLLRQSDFVTLHTDLNPSSRHLMNRETIALMKRSAVLINTSRGPVVNEVDLIEALERGIISGAGLDVFEHEPLPVESPLRRMANVMCASHNSNSSPAAWERVHRSTLDQLYKGLREVRRVAA
jgi:D-3-phosphoglycerate dehydrogenase